MAVEAASIPTGGRSILGRSPLARLPDRALKYGLTALAGLILALIVYFFIRLVGQARPAFAKEGLVGFVFGNDWNVSAEHFGALPLLVGTLITSALALVIGVPVAVATAIYATELCPRRLRAPLTVLVELLAAVPSVVYGLWGIFFLAPKLQGAEQWVADRLSFVPFIGGGLVTIPNYFITGLVLAIMILPIVSAISREVMTTVPADHKEAALGLGATRWEMIRIAVLPYCRSGIVGGAMLGLGRAIGETIAVTILIGDAPQLGHHLFSQGYSLAAVIANEFGEAQGLHRSALFAAGLVLFVLTLLVNALARVLVARAGRGKPQAPPGSREAPAACWPTRRPAHELPRSIRGRITGRPAGALCRQPGAQAQGPHRPHEHPRRHHNRAHPPRADRLLPAAQGPGLVELRASSRPTRPATRSSGARASAASRARSSARSRSSRSPRRSRSRSGSASRCGWSSTARTAGSRRRCASSSTC